MMSRTMVFFKNKTFKNHGLSNPGWIYVFTYCVSSSLPRSMGCERTALAFSCVHDVIVQPRATASTRRSQFFNLSLAGLELITYNHLDVDRIRGVHKEYIMVLSKIIFYLLHDGCSCIGIHCE